MQRATWTDDWLDDLSHRVDAGFSRVDHRFELVDQRFQLVDQRFDEVDRRFADVNVRFDQVDRRLDQVDRRLDTLKDGIVDIHKTLNRVGGAIVASLAGVVATILGGGG